ncbi:MAG TPA: AAA family ATPase [Solirubrobacter sp.]|nr:AAA family ATPase [Solirubrobacter sp.]
MSEHAPTPFTVFGYSDLLRMPDPPWLIDGLLPGNGLSVLYGAPKSGKSFIAIDWAMSIASGRSWLGRAVQRGWVLYIAAEGVGGLKARARAWHDTHDKPTDDDLWIRWLPEAVDLRNREQIERARSTIATLPEAPRLIVVDTMARTMPGGDENAARDVGEFIAALDLLRAGQAILVVHHAGKAGDSHRGSSALRGAADLMARVERDDRGPKLTLACEDMKDAAEFEPIPLRLEPASDSCVISLQLETVEARDDLHDRVLDFIRADGPVSQNTIEKKVEGRATEIRRARVALADANLIHKPGRGWEVRPSDRDALGTHPFPALAEEVRPAGGKKTKSSPVGTHPEPASRVPRPDIPDVPGAPELPLDTEADR